MERGKYNPALIYGVSEEDETAGNSKTGGTNTEESVSASSDEQLSDSQHTFKRSFSEIHRNRSRQYFRSLYLKRRQFRQPHDAESSSTQHEEAVVVVKQEPARSDQAATMNRVDIRFNITDSIDESEEINLDMKMTESFNARSDTDALRASLSHLRSLHVDGMRTMTTSHSAPLGEHALATQADEDDTSSMTQSQSASSPVSHLPTSSASWNHGTCSSAWPRQVHVAGGSWALSNARAEMLSPVREPPKRMRSTSYGGFGFEGPASLPPASLERDRERPSSPHYDLAQSTDTDLLPIKHQSATSFTIGKESRSMSLLHAVSSAPPVQPLFISRSRSQRANSVMSYNSSASASASVSAAAVSIGGGGVGSVSTSASASGGVNPMYTQHPRKYSVASISSAYDSCFRSAAYLERMHRRTSKPRGGVQPFNSRSSAGTLPLLVPPQAAKSLTNLTASLSGTARRASNDRKSRRSGSVIHADMMKSALNYNSYSNNLAFQALRPDSPNSAIVSNNDPRGEYVPIRDSTYALIGESNKSLGANSTSVNHINNGVTSDINLAYISENNENDANSANVELQRAFRVPDERQQAVDCARTLQSLSDVEVVDNATLAGRNLGLNRFDDARNNVSKSPHDKRESSPSSSSANRAEEKQCESISRLLVTRDFKTAIQKARSINLISDIKQSTAGMSSCLRLRGPEPRYKSLFSSNCLSTTVSSPHSRHKRSDNADSLGSPLQRSSDSTEDRAGSTAQQAETQHAEFSVVLMDSFDRSSLFSNNVNNTTGNNNGNGNSKAARDSITLTTFSQYSGRYKTGTSNHLSNRRANSAAIGDNDRETLDQRQSTTELDGLLAESTLTNNELIHKRDSACGGSKKKQALETCATNKHTIADRLRLRKKLFHRRQIVADLALTFALIGIFLMVMENETTVQNIKAMTAILQEKENNPSPSNFRPPSDRSSKELRESSSTSSGNSTGSSSSKKRSKSKSSSNSSEASVTTTSTLSGTPSSSDRASRSSTDETEDLPIIDWSDYENDTCFKLEQPIGRAVREAVLPYKLSRRSYLTKVAISISTLLVEFFIIIYQILEIQVYCVDNCVLDWRLAMSPSRFMQIALELLVCGIHPLPHFDRSHMICIGFMQPANTALVISYVPIDIALGLPMVFRAYLIVRVVVLHSRLMSDASSRSIGAMNRITFNTTFVFKTFMTNKPGITLTVFIMMLWFVNSWIIHVCESFHNEQFHIYSNAIWHTAVTFFSIGYGDVVPITYWGRTISISTGLMGAGCTAFLVAVVARKLELTRAEKHVHNFMTDSQLTKELKAAAANVIRETWLIYKGSRQSKRREGEPVPLRVCMHQQKLLDAIQHLREVKIKQRKLTDAANALIDVVKLHSDLGETIEETRESQIGVTQRIDLLEEKLRTLQTTVDMLPDLLVEKLNAAMNRTGGYPWLGRSVSNYEFQNVAKQPVVATQSSQCQPTESRGTKQANRQLSNSGASLSSSNAWYLQNARN